MLLKRRKPPTWFEYFRISLWPRRSWMRSGQYVTKRVLRITASPHAVAAGVAAGVFTSFTPFMGFHFVIAALVAFLVRGNMIASALGTFFGNPLSFPIIWAATYGFGRHVLGYNTADGDAVPPLGEAMSQIIDACYALNGGKVMQAINDIWEPILYPMMIGGFIIGPLVGFIVYMITKRGALLFREKRRNKLMAKAALIRDRARAASENKAMSNHGQSA